MTAPLLTVYQQGLGAVNADNLNTFEQTCDTITQLSGFVGTTGVMVSIRGLQTPGDGGGGPFWWNPNLVGATSDFVNVVVPNGAAAGGWVRLGYWVVQPSYSYQTPATGFSITLGTGTAYLVLNPATTLATGTITLATPLRDGYVVRISTSQTITSLTLNSVAGYSISNAPATLSAGGVVGFIYVQSVTTWFRA